MQPDLLHSAPSQHLRYANLRIPLAMPFRFNSSANIISLLYAFDPRRVAILLLGGNKGGDDRWYEENIPKADKLYDEHLRELEEEGLL